MVSAEGTTETAVLATFRAAPHTIEPPPITTELVPLRSPMPIPTLRPTAVDTTLAPEDTASGVMAANEGKYFHAPSAPASGRWAESSSRSSSVW